MNPDQIKAQTTVRVSIANSLKAREDEARQLRATVALLKEEGTLLEKQANARNATSGGGRRGPTPTDINSNRQVGLFSGSDLARTKRILQERKQAEIDATSERIQAELDLEASAIEWVAKMREDAIAHGLQQRREEADAQAAIMQQTRDETVASVTSAASTVAGLTQSLVADLVSGQEQALERFGLSVMAQAGQVLVGEGIKLAGAATTSALTGLLPLAAVQGAGSAGLIAAGVGLGGTAVGLGGLLGGGAQSAPTSAPRLTTGGSGGGTSSGGGNTVVQITYAGASGPTADHAAVAATDALRRADRRRIRAVERV
jgi:hypothetical protein